MKAIESLNDCSLREVTILMNIVAFCKNVFLLCLVQGINDPCVSSKSRQTSI